MSNNDGITKLKRLQTEANRIRRKLQISPPSAVLYLASLGEWDDRRVIVEADGFGGATTSVVEGNYPIDYVSHYAKKFESEEEACDAAEDIAEQDSEPEAVLT